jgi:hypothetical protein
MCASACPSDLKDFGEINSVNRFLSIIEVDDDSEDFILNILRREDFFFIHMREIEMKRKKNNGNEILILPEIEWRFDSISSLILLFMILHVRCKCRGGIITTITKTALKSV